MSYLPAFKAPSPQWGEGAERPDQSDRSLKPLTAVAASNESKERCARARLIGCFVRPEGDRFRRDVYCRKRRGGWRSAHA